MKTKLVIFLTIVLFIALGSCEKYERAKTAREQIHTHRLGQKAGKEFVNSEKYIDSHRSGFTLEDCAELAQFKADLISSILEGELISELKNIVSILSIEYRKQRDEGTDEESIEDRKSRLWERVAGGDENIVDPELNRILNYYPRHLVAYVHTYIIDTLLFGGGVRIDNYNNPANYHEQHILDMFESVITWDYPEEWIIKYRDEAYWYLYYYAVDPANYAEAKSMGLPVPSIDEMKKLYPPEKINQFKGKSVKGKTDRQLFQEWTLTQADYTQIDWKPVSIQAEKK